MAAEKNKKNKAVFEEVLAASKPRRHTVKVCANGELVDRQNQLEQELEVVRREDHMSNRKPQAPAVARKIEALQKEAEESSFTFVFQAVGLRQWNELMAKHPPTPQQKKMAKEENISLQFDLEKFPVAAVALSCVEPEMSLEDAQKLYDSWNFSQWNALWNAALEANIGDASVPKSAIASLTLGRITQKSERQSDSESPEVSSLGEL